MRPSDRYHKWVEWSDEDQVYIGHCPDFITGIHGDDLVQLYDELCTVVDEVSEHFKSSIQAPPSGTHPPNPNGRSVAGE